MAPRTASRQTRRAALALGRSVMRLRGFFEAILDGGNYAPIASCCGPNSLLEQARTRVFPSNAENNSIRSNLVGPEFITNMRFFTLVIRRFRNSVLGLGAMLMTFSASAQTGAIERADNSLNRRGASEPLLAEQFSPVEEGAPRLGDYAPPSTGDLDIGIQRILKKAERATPFWFAADVNVFVTDNAFYTPENEEDDVFGSLRVAFGYRPKLGGNWYLDASLSQEFLRYEENGVLDYELFNGGVGIVRLVPELWNIVAAAGYTFERVTLGDLADDFYLRHSVGATLQKQFALTPFQRVILAANGSFDLDVDIEVLTRNEYGAQVAYEYHFASDWHVRGFYNFLYRDYTELDRNDATHILGAAVSWRPKPWFQAELIATYSSNDSSIDALDYESGIAGIGAVVSATF